jgi:hypothetical protein
MAQELTEKDLRTRRLKSCVQSFHNAETGENNPRCCRFPKNCSPYATIEAYQAGNISENDLEPAESAPVRFEPATTAQSNAPIPRRRDDVFQAEQKMLRQYRVGHSFRSMMHTDVDLDVDRGQQVHRLESFVLQEHLADDVYIDMHPYTVPKTWWDMFKLTFASTWWLGWLVKRRPAQFDRHVVKSAVKVERYASYPEADVAIPQLGRPLPFESVRRLTKEEIEDFELQKLLEKQDAEREENMWVFSLIPETFEDLAEYTGLPKEHFEATYRYDQEFGLNSKIYLIPEGVGYR